MAYTLTYLETASDFANLLSAIVTYERERLTAISETTIRKQDYVRAERSEVSAFNTEITSTYNALIMHYDLYKGDDAENPYMGFTPVAVSSALCALGMARTFAANEADLALWWSYQDHLDADTMAEQRILSSDLRALDYFLYGKACQLNQTTLVQSPNSID